jgi:hypothetical protein
MIYLNSDSFIGKGAHKKCYVHPSNELLCIKISRRYAEKIVEKEIKYYRYLQKKGIDSPIISNYHGSVETNYGKGYVFDLVRDFDGSISKSVDFYVNNKKIHPCLIKAFQNFERNMEKDLLITRKLKERNLLYKKLNEKSGEIVLIDDIGPSELIPVGLYSSFFAKKKIRRKIEEFKTMIKKNFFNLNPAGLIILNIADLIFF